jgi:hypothetical protein
MTVTGTLLLGWSDPSSTTTTTTTPETQPLFVFCPNFLQLERVFMTVTGTLLLGWSDPSGTVARLRQDLAAAFPGASSKQSNIIHTSLLRIVTTTAATPQCCQQQDEAGVSLAAGSGGGKPQQQQQQQQQEERQLDEAGLSLAAGSGGGNPLRQQEQQEQQLPAAVVAAVGELCERLTQQHRGLRVSVGQLHWTIEEQFSTVQGSQVAAPLAPVAPQLCGAQPAAP